MTDNAIQTSTSKRYGFRAMLVENKTVQFLTKYFLLFALVVVVAIFSCLNSNFLTAQNITNILKSTCVTCLISCAAMINLNSGALNFCLGTQSTLTAAVIGVLLANEIVDNYWTAVLIGFFACLLVGCISTFFCVNLKVPAFIATLSISTILGAFNNMLTGGSEMYSNNWPPIYNSIGNYTVGNIPVSVIIVVILCIISWMFMEKTKLGRHLYASGANSVAAKQVGINIGKMQFIAFMIGSMYLAFAGLIQTSTLDSVMPTMGDDLLLPSISSAMLGATFLTPGKYNVPGTVVASLLTTCIQVGVAGLGMGNFVTDICQGVIFVIAVGIIALVRAEGLPKVSIA